MKRGDYMIHIFVEKAKSIAIKDGLKVDPMIQLNCMAQRKFSSALKDIDNMGIANWSEHIFFEFRNLESEELGDAKVSLKLMDKSVFRDDMIGIYEFDLSYLYG